MTINIAYYEGVNENSIIPKEDYNDLLNAYKSQQADLKQVKEAVFKVVDLLGMRNEDGSFKDKIDFKKISGLVSSLLLNSDSIKEKFAFLQSTLPLLEKYKDV